VQNHIDNTVYMVYGFIDDVKLKPGNWSVKVVSYPQPAAYDNADQPYRYGGQGQPSDDNEDGYGEWITPDLAEGDLSPKLQCRLRPTPFQSHFLALNSTANYLSWLAIPDGCLGFFKAYKEMASYFVPSSLKFFFAEPPYSTRYPLKNHTPKAPKLSLGITPSRPREVPPKKTQGRGGCPEARPRQPAPSPGLEKRVTRELVQERLARLAHKQISLQKEYGIMEQKLQMVEFGVTGLEEVRTLVKRWKQVLAGLAKEDEGPTMVWQTRRQVGVEVEDRRPGEEVLLTFLAPREVVERFLADLRQEGLEVCEEPLIPGVAITCRLGARNLQ
jgi:hypothetical protein